MSQQHTGSGVVPTRNGLVLVKIDIEECEHGKAYMSHDVYSPSIQRHSGHTDLTVLTAHSVQYSANSATLFAVFRRNIWSLIKAVGIGLVIALVLVEIYARFWFICAVDDLCCAANTPWR